MSTASKGFELNMEAPKFKRIVSLLGKMHEELTFTISPDGVSCKVMDPTHAAVMDLMLKKDYFIDYGVTDITEICVRSVDLQFVVGFMGNDAQVTLVYQEAAPGVIHVKIQTQYLDDHELKLVGIDESKKVTQNVSLPKPYCEVEIQSQSLSRIFEMKKLMTASKFGTSCTFLATNDALRLKFAGVLGKRRVSFEKGLTVTKLVMPQGVSEYKSVYATSFLTQIIPPLAAFADHVTMTFANDTLLTMRIDSPTVALRASIAPK
jgi:hypothetical protein